MKRVVVLGLAFLGTAGCNNLQGLGGKVPPLATFQVEATGDIGSLPPVSLQVALVWGAQWLTEPFCILPPDSASVPPDQNSVTAVIAAGCRDPFGFVPSLVGASVPVTLGTPTPLPLFNPPPTDVLVGDATSRVGYASLVFYDDRDGTGTLEFSESHPTPFGGDNGPDQQDQSDSRDVIYGASFLTMTALDQRVSFLDGTFNPLSAFYPRNGCPPPADNSQFQVLTAGGFSAAAGLASAASGTLPIENPPCAVEDPATALVTITAQSPADVAEVSCTERTLDGTTRYRQPPTDAPDFNGRAIACAHLPSFDAGDQTSLIQLVVSGLPTDHCKGLTHYTLRGCREDVSCAVPDWDFTANPPAWWPC
ncbi:MAG TPA: hypothetical protein VLA79_07780 [Polyangia bacterium]|nr:hypothetical protein [Polyangia bacterium]